MLRLVPALVTLPTIVGAFLYGYRVAESRWETLYDATVAEYEAARARIEAEAARRTAEAEARARAIEAQHAADLAAITQAHEEALRNATAERDRTIDALRTDALRVRERFTCPEPAGVSGTDRDRTAEAPGGGQLDHAGARRGLSVEDAGFLLRIAAEADEIVHQLRACQAVIRRDRGL